MVKSKLAKKVLFLEFFWIPDEHLVPPHRANSSRRVIPERRVHGQTGDSALHGRGVISTTPPSTTVMRNQQPPSDQKYKNPLLQFAHQSKKKLPLANFSFDIRPSVRDD